MRVSGRCPYCQSREGLDDDPVRCTGCAAVYHRDCWLEFGGCAVPGCTKAPAQPAAAADARPASARPQPTVTRAAAATAAPAASTQLPPPGWFPDPEGSPRQRWWDGSAWTGHYYPPS